jgi:hypothetical protein
MLYSINETHKNGWGSFYGIKSNRIKIIWTTLNKMILLLQ